MTSTPVRPSTDGPSAPPRRRLCGLARAAVRHSAVVPIGAVALALVIGAVVILAAGLDPVTAYSAVLEGALDPGSLDYTLAVWGFISGMALTAAIPLRMGEFNLGGNGQLVLGGLAAAVIGSSLPLPSVLLLPVALAAAAVLGAAFAAISAPLATRFGIPVIISSLLLAPIAVAVVSYLLRFQIGEQGAAVAQTPRLPDAAHLWSIGGSSYANVGLVVILLALVAFWIVDTRTAVGFELRVVGSNRRFGAYGGVRVPRLTLGAMLASGAAAGLVGAVIVLSAPYRLVDGALLSPGYTFAGLAAALLAGGRPALLPVTAALFTILQVGGAAMERSADVPRQLSDVLQGVVIIVLALRTVLELRRTSRQGSS